MGYTTQYSIVVRTMIPDKTSRNKIVEDIAKELTFLTNYDWDTDLYLEAKWYQWVEDMMYISKEHLGLLFIVDGAGEDKGDYWRSYFLDGKAQHCKSTIVYEPFDIEKMK